MSDGREKTSSRPYTSPLRESQREATKQAIVEAAYELLKTTGELTVAAIAARAGVSVPTVNRHFPSRQALLEGLVEHLDAVAGAGPRPSIDPATFLSTGLEPLVRSLFERFAQMPAHTTAATAAVMELRSKVTIPRRRRLTDETIAAVLPDLAEPHRTWLSDLLVVVLSSSMVHTMQGYLGLTPDESATRIHWLLDALFGEARRLAEAPPSRRPAKRPTKKKTTAKKKRGGRR